jgi:hypothetical protein
MPNCSTCGEPVEFGSKYIAMLSHQQFKWGCEHKPVFGAIAYFGSQNCFFKWALDRGDGCGLEAYLNFIETSVGEC